MASLWSERKGGSGSLSTSSLAAYLPLEAEDTCCLRVHGKARNRPPTSCCALKPFGSKPHILYCIGLREDYYKRFKVPAVQSSATIFFYILPEDAPCFCIRCPREKESLLCELEVKQYSNKAWYFATRCCVDAEVIATW